MILDLEEKVPFAEQILVEARHGDSLFGLASLQVPVHFSHQASGGSDQTFRMFFENLLIHARAMVKPFEITGRR